MRNFFCLLYFLSNCIVFSQEDAWVYFKDKPNAAAALSNPLTILTQRSLDRRAKQGIVLDDKDVPVYQPYIEQILATNGIVVKAKSKWLNCVHVRGSQLNINALKSLSVVSSIHFADRSLNAGSKKLDTVLKFSKSNRVKETKINYDYGKSGNQIQMLNGHLLHQLNFTGAGKIIAVLDSGFPEVNTAQVFKRLQTNNQILGGYNYVTKNSNFYTGNNHGTNVLSLMGGF